MADFGRGVLYPDEHAAMAVLDRRAPSARLAPFVEHFWNVRWNVREPYQTKVLAHPSVHLVFEEPAARVYGVDRGLFVRTLEGRGQVLGVKFRPGGFRPLAGGPVLDLADRSVPAADLFGDLSALNAAILGAPDAAAMAALAEDFLDPLLPAEPDPLAADAAEIVERIAADPSLTRVDEAAALLGVSVRTLQRLFGEYVGASPKWVLRRARLQEAAARADAGRAVDWAALAADLGYADQAHLSRDFTATVGTPPSKYART
ncbi:helix-turn-helix domain-containing protein [Actinomadura parmotrematis]|uniref:Helix-turn-helix domain-containing protein n=1 Tax=Actinomadura parmotrematis TaxID=2864039 RepID=A0ABS7G4E1_9ACTN|nr:helix-turn-helix domain-containing protein [Actinomadura parmotrematis]MBW8487558.1 helix-turn-helix domain-containing protein [Actinomadura parmotrematis]